MTRRLLAIAVVLIVAGNSLSFSQEKREPIPITKVMFEGVNWPLARSPQDPLIIETRDDLEATFPEDKSTQVEVLKQFRPGEQRLVVFHWRGSGGDKLELVSGDPEQKELPTFFYTRGLTRDLRPHQHIYLLPRGMKFNVQTPRK